MLTITVEDYRPSPVLDEELASLGSAAIHGWPDQAPVNASLVRAMLRPAGMTATTLALHRDADGRLLGGAAVRWPATLDAAGRLWGPIVRPDAERKGLGRSLMRFVTDLLASHPGVLVRTTDIPQSREHGWSLFVAAGWDSAGESELYQRPIDPFEVRDERATVAVRSAVAGEYLAPALAELFAAAHPDLGPTTARDTYARWSADSRYTPDGLLLVDADGRLIGAAIVHPSPSTQPDEPAEALIGDVLVSPDLPADAAVVVRRSLVEGALKAGAAAGMTVARSVVDSPDIAEALIAAGFTVVDRVRRYSYRGSR
jgi:GNAT superfamily N-acetyltransferase